MQHHGGAVTAGQPVRLDCQFQSNFLSQALPLSSGWSAGRLAANRAFANLLNHQCIFRPFFPLLSLDQV